MHQRVYNYIKQISYSNLQNTLFSGSHGTLRKIEHVLNHKYILINLKKQISLNLCSQTTVVLNYKSIADK